MPGSRRDDDTSVLPATPPMPIPAGTSSHSLLPPMASGDYRRRPPSVSSAPDPVLRVWIEELPPGISHRPETMVHFSAGRTVLNVVGSRQAVAAALKTVTGELAQTPWWMFWARRRPC